MAQHVQNRHIKWSAMKESVVKTERNEDSADCVWGNCVLCHTAHVLLNVYIVSLMSVNMHFIHSKNKVYNFECALVGGGTANDLRCGHAFEAGIFKEGRGD